MIKRLLYLSATRLDFMHDVFFVARFQEDHKETHVVAIKIIFTIFEWHFRLWLMVSQGY